MSHFEDQINCEILDVWERNIINGSNDVLMPIFYSNLVRHNLLFVGINPSFNTNGIDNMFKSMTGSQYDVNEYFLWKNRNNFSIEISTDLDSKIREKYPYFSKFRDIAAHLEMKWEHIDMFHNRETSQNELKKVIFSDSINRKLNRFGNEQINLFKKILNYISPQLIVVANALASNIFENEFDVSFQDNVGYHKVIINNKPIPLFLSSMLTGQRALDNYSYTRLRWHIKKAFTNSMN